MIQPHFVSQAFLAVQWFSFEGVTEDASYCSDCDHVHPLDSNASSRENKTFVSSG